MLDLHLVVWCLFREEFVENVRLHCSQLNDFFSIVFEPGWFINELDGISVAVTHGSPWPYDTFVPIIFAGYKLKPQTVARRVHTVDVALTLANIVGAKPPSGASGNVLLEVVEQ